MNEEILNKEGAAQLLRVKPRTIQDWMKKRIIPHSKLPSGAIRFQRSKLLEWITKYESRVK